MIYKNILFPLVCALTSNDTEYAHTMGMWALKICGLPPMYSLFSKFTYVPGNEVEVFGIQFPSPVGLAAGFEKNATVPWGIAALSPGFIEIGTVVPKYQKGNPRPRMFRLFEDRAIINRMGFNSIGSSQVERRLSAHFEYGYRKPPMPIGINVGANKNTPIKDAHRDYAEVIRVLYPFADYLTVNVSSPNTPGLRELQFGSYLEQLLETVRDAVVWSARNESPKPILLKIAPDLKYRELEELCEKAEQYVDGLIIGNTTVKRSKELLSPYRDEAGGLSGAPLRKGALRLVYHASKRCRLPIVYAGGASCADDVRRAQDAGAILVQVLTGMIYEGPMIFRNINRELAC